MAVCKFFLGGNCKFGDRCRFEHPAGGAQQSRSGYTGNAPQENNHLNSNQHRRQQQHNQFGALENRIETPGGSRNNARFGGSYVAPHQPKQHDAPTSQRGRGFQGNRGDRRNPPRPNQYGLHEAEIVAELRERPEWPMSCFGPGKNPPINLWGGEVEQSPEELRTLHYLALASGAPQRTAQMEGDMAAAASNFIKNALEDPSGAIEYIVSAENQPGNRFDNTRFERHKFPLFSVDNYNKRRGVFEHIPRNKTPQTGRSHHHQVNAQAGLDQQQISGFGHEVQRTYGQHLTSAQAQEIDLLAGQQVGFESNTPQAAAQSSTFRQPHMGALMAHSGFGHQPNAAFGQTQDMPMDASMASPTFGSFNQQPQIAHNSGFGQLQNGDLLPELPQNETNFGNGPPGGRVGTNQASKATANAISFGGSQQDFRNGETGSLTQTHGLMHPQQRGTFDNASNPGGATVVAAGPGLQPGSTADAYAFMKETGTFRDGIMPEIAPPEDLIS